jgi:hypothetical protein
VPSLSSERSSPEPHLRKQPLPGYPARRAYPEPPSRERYRGHRDRPSRESPREAFPSPPRAIYRAEPRRPRDRGRGRCSLARPARCLSHASREEPTRCRRTRHSPAPARSRPSLEALRRSSGACEEVPLTSSAFSCNRIPRLFYRRGVRLYVRSTLSFRRSSTGHPHLEARRRGLRSKPRLAQMMRKEFVLLGAYRASQ